MEYLLSAGALLVILCVLAVLHSANQDFNDPHQ